MRVVQNTVEISDKFKALVEEVKNESLHEMNDAFKHISELAKELRDGDGLLHKLVYSKKDGDTILDSLSGT